MDIKVDTREKDRIYKYLVDVFPQHNFIKTKLDEGDFETEHVLIERKSMNDLYLSITGKRTDNGSRLESQMCRLGCRSDKIVCYLITGDINEFASSFRGNNLNINVIYGAIGSLCARERFHIIWVPDDYDGLNVMVKIMKTVEDGKYMVPSRREPNQLMARLLKVTPLQMEALMIMFGSVYGISNASLSELTRLHGIGPGKAKFIKDALNSRW